MFVTIRTTYCTNATDFVRHLSASVVHNIVSNSTKVNVEQTTTFLIRIHSALKQHSIGNSISNTNRIHLRGNYGAS